MIINDSVKVKNYKCFGEVEQGIDAIYPINIIIGKNNIGKSSLLDIVSTISSSENNYLVNSGRNGKPSEINITHTFSEEQVRKIYKDKLHENLFKSIFDCTATIKRTSDTMNIISFSKTPSPSIIDRQNFLMNGYFLSDKRYKCITAERDIIPEGENIGINRSSVDTKVLVTPDGKGATSLLQSLLIDDLFNRHLRLVKIDLLNALNTILNPEIQFDDIIIQANNHTWEILFREKNGFIKLSKMGSGIKTILLTLINLMVIPVVESRQKSQYLFAFEELENNLHPSLLRRLFYYIKMYSETNQTYFFITTHSSIVIDLFSRYKNAQIIHVTSDGERAICNQVSTFRDNKIVLQDLDVKASDLLQSNGIIWVEGPSDRIYINKWLSIVSPELIEGIHFSVLFYGGRLLANLSFDIEWLEKELIPLLKINHNAFVVIDRDGDHLDSKINKTKERIQKEIGENACWITNGREIENYLSENTLNKWVSKYCSNKIKTNPNSKLEDIVRIADKKDIIKYNADKKDFSIEISEHIFKEDIEVLDLNEKLEYLVREIKKWNSL